MANRRARGDGLERRVIQVQLVTNGKWHAPHPTAEHKTACGTRVPMTASRRDVDLVDSTERCRDQKCVTARAATR